MSDDADLSARRLRLRRAVEELRDMKGMGTELVTVIIPPDRQISDVRGQLGQESGQAANIKSKSTRKHVQDAIESAISTLNKFRTPGEYGVAIFVGHVIVGNNKTRLVSRVLTEAVEPFSSFRYRCDNRFEITQLEEQLTDRTAYGLFVIDRSEAAWGMASGTRLHVQEHIYSQVPSKHGRGGQSAQRFERLIEEAAHNFFKKASERASNYWVPMVADLKGIIVGGPGATKEYVVKHGYFHHEVQKKIVDTMFDVGYSNESGLRELIDEAGSLMHEINLDGERKVMGRFLREIMEDHPKATYGEMMVRQALEQGAVETLLVSEGLRRSRLSLTCGACGESFEVTSTPSEPTPSCSSCNSEDVTVTDEEELLDELAVRAEQISADVCLVSVDTEEGATLLTGFGGLAALLRYAIV
ncbi:MAG: peptide chain release factor 1 [Euryarchaeota archaeon]|nr:peptide chain release factor 1 [Euryarchaeota archaeon]